MDGHPDRGDHDAFIILFIVIGVSEGRVEYIQLFFDWWVSDQMVVIDEKEHIGGTVK